MGAQEDCITFPSLAIHRSLLALRIYVISVQIELSIDVKLGKSCFRECGDSTEVSAN